MSYNSSLPADTTAQSEIRENFRALKEDKIVAAATAVVAESAEKLANARVISLKGDAVGSASFDGSADVFIAVDVLSADTSAQCTGNAATATKLETARNINGVAFDGTKDITITQINGKDIATVDKIPTSLPANGGNADTIDGLHASDLIAASVPVGGIIMWSGKVDTVPEKWALCNGTNGTPDLRDKFVLGAGNSYTVGKTGGEVTHTLTVAEMPSHSHDMLNLCLRQRPNGPGDSDITVQWNQGFRTSDTGGNQPHNNMPPYYALAYIMRIA